MSTEGPRGVGVNRPGSRAEIQKLPRHTCERCGLSGPTPMVRWDGVSWTCSNRAACNRRDEKGEETKP